MKASAGGKKLPSLRVVSFCVIGVTLLFFTGIIVFVFALNMLGALERNERESMRQQGDIAAGIISASNANIQPVTRDWSSWDETYAYTLGENENYITDVLTEYPFLLHYLSFAVIKDMDGNDLHARFYDAAGEQELPVPEGFTDRLTEIGADMLESYDPGRAYNFKEKLGKDGFLSYNGVCYYICAMPILTSDETAGPAGSFFFGRVYDEREITRITGGASLKYAVLDGASPEIQNLGAELSGNEAFCFGKDNYVYYRALSDCFGDNGVVIRIEEPRRLYKDGLSVIMITCLVAGGVVLLLLAAVGYLMNRHLLRPLARLSSAVGSVTGAAQSVDTGGYGGSREIYILETSINNMLERLAQNRVHMEESAFSLNVLKAILNGMDAFLYVSDIHTDEILFINDRMKEHFKLGNGAVGSVCWKALQSGFEKKCDFCPIYRLLEEPGAPVLWEEHNTATGRYYRNIDRVIEWSDGKKVHLQHSTDITDIRLAEATLKKRLEQQELMSAVSQSFASTQDTRRLIYEALKMAGEFMGVSQAFLSRYRRDEGFLECLYEWCDEEAQPYIGSANKWPISPDMQIYRDLTVNGYAAINDYAMLTHPNFKAVKDYELRAFLNIPIEVSGEFWGILGFIINKRTYDWNESDIHLGKMMAGVFSGVVSRNMAEENLLKAKETAEQASRAKGEFLSRMSHEMRTPMNAIIGMTEIARNSGDLRKAEYCLERIDSASRHLLGIINDILDMSKIEANKLELSPSEFDFERMLINITGVVNFRVEEKKQDLIINIDKNVPSSFIGDEMRFSQVIANLLTNAVKFTPEGGAITLNIHNSGVSDGVSTLLVEVIDNGIGISKEQQARLFTPFEQADGGIARKYGGTGLGLTICKGIVELMEGRIWIESELGKGTKISFIVKMKVGKESPKAKPAGVTGKDGIRILAVDDAPEIREYFTHVMPALGLRCDVAGSGAEALEMIKQNKGRQYNIFFVDWMMPDINGVDLTREIKRVTSDNAVIIMISVADWSNVEKGATAAGVDMFISKPLFPSVLVNAINEAVGAPPPAEASGDKTRAYDFSNHTLLLAEDVEINREIISAVLEDTKITIDFAQNGVEALSMFESDPGRYGLILMDIHMPEMDGYEATQKIRALDAAKAKSIPIIAMTANVFREDVEKCIQAGMNEHIGKPVETGELLAKLDKYLSAEPV